MNRRIIVLSLGIAALFQFSFQTSSQINLIPQPLSVTLEEGSFRLSEKTKIVLPEAYQNELGKYISNIIFTETGIKCETKTELSKTSSGNYVEFNTTENPDTGREGYILNIFPDHIQAEAKGYADQFFVIQSH